MTADTDAKLIEQGRKLFAGDWQFFWASPSIETAAADGRHRGRVRRPLQCRQIQPDQCADRPQRAGAHLAHAGPHPGTDLLRRPGRAGLRLVDMPGYGYASAPKAKVASWTALIHKFLQGRGNLARVYVLIDARHGLKDVDLDVLKTLDKSAVSYQVVLTKADQVKPAELEQRIAATVGSACQASRRVSGRAGDILAHRRRHAGIARRDGAPARRAQPMMRPGCSASWSSWPASWAPTASSWRRGGASARRRAAWRRRPRCCCFMPPPCSRRWRWPSAASFIRGSAMAAACGFVIAAALFAGDLTLRQYAGHSLFPLAAPTGGTLLIASWLVLAVAAAWPRRSVDRSTARALRRARQSDRNRATLSAADPETRFMTDAPHISPLDQARILSEALPHMQQYDEETIVIKYGGHAMGAEDIAKAFARDIVLLEQTAINPVVVHGGGPQIATMLKRLGIKSEFAAGLRITDAATIEIVEMVLAGSINKQLVGYINEAGGKAVGLCGKDGNMVTASKATRTMVDPDSQHRKGGRSRLRRRTRKGRPDAAEPVDRL